MNIGKNKENIMNKILENYNRHCSMQSDIHEHLPTLKEYTEKCESVTEMGVRGIVFTWAFLAGNPKKMTSYDIAPPANWGSKIEDVYDAVKETSIDFQFILADVLKIEIEPVDLLFIDTWHVYDQLTQELKLHNKNVKKYIIFHDTTSFEFSGETPGYGGLWRAIVEFLEEHAEWELHKRYTNNNGLTILKRI